MRETADSIARAWTEARTHSAMSEAAMGYRPFRRRAALDRAAQDLADTRPTFDGPAAGGSARPKPVAAKPQPQTADRVPPPAPLVLTGQVLAPAPRPEPADPRERNLWDELRRVNPGVRDHLLDRAPLISFFRNSPTSRAFDLLRTRLLQALRANGWNRVAIASPTPGCGATFTAVNLALSLARVPASRTVLVDLNQRSPGVAAAMGLDAPGSIGDFLTGQRGVAQHMLRAGPRLAVGLTDTASDRGADILHDPRTARSLAGMASELRPDVTLFDLPPVLSHDDAAAFLPQVDGVLLVADATQTLPAHISACEKVLNGQARVLGVVLNRGRDAETQLLPV